MRPAPLFAAAVLAFAVLAACSGGSGSGTDPGPTVDCHPAGAACASPSDCCTADCVGNACMPSLLGGECVTTGDCFAPLTCQRGICANPSCKADGAACLLASDCCAVNCRTNGVCGPNRAPLVSAGADQQVFRRVDVTLDGSASDADGDTIRYSWTLQRPAGSSAYLSSQTVQRPTFDTDVEGAYVATLQVWDGHVYASDSVTVTAVNRPPVADIGVDREVMRNVTVFVDASASSDPDLDVLSFVFELSKPAGSGASLQFDGDYYRRSFRPDVVGVYTVTVTASDGKLTDTASVAYTAVNVPPEATVTALAAVNARERVDVTATAIQDRNYDPITSGWRLDVPAASAAALSTATGTTTSYTPDVPGTYTVHLDLSDGFESSTVSRATVVYPPVVKLAHDVTHASCGSFCTTVYTTSQAPANELWRFFVVPGDADWKMATLSGPALALAQSEEDYAVIGLSGKVGTFVGTVYSECALPQWTDSTGALRTYDAGGVALGPRVTIGTGKTTRDTRFAYVVPAPTANGGKDLLSVDMGDCTVTATPGPAEGFDGAVALRPGTASLYVLDGATGQVLIYDTSVRPPALTSTSAISGEPGRSFWFMDGGAAILTPSGAVHDAASLALAGELGSPAPGDPKHVVLHASSSVESGRIAAIRATGLSGTPLDDALWTYSATTFAAAAAPAPLPWLARSGVAYPTRGVFAGHRTRFDATIWVIVRTEPGVSPEGWGIAPMRP